MTPKVVPPGRGLVLTLELPALGRSVRARGTVIWTRPEAPARLGIRLQPRLGDRRWFEQLAEADPPLAAAARAVPDHLPARARLHLGLPPRHVVDFTVDELEVLRRVQAGIAAEELVSSFGAGSERVVGAVFALLARRFLVVRPVEGGGPFPWRPVLAKAQAAAATDGLAAVASPDGASRARPAAAQRLYDEGIAQLAAGRFALAAARFEEAMALAPDDEVIDAQLRRLAPWT